MPKYGKKAQDKVEETMHEFKEGTLKSGSSGRKVTNPKQAIAIGLSEARDAGAKVPKTPSARGKPAGSKTSANKKSAKKTSAKKASAKKASAKKAPARKSSKQASAKKTSAKKAPARKSSKQAARK
jgi:hypothetical protein